MQKINKIDLQEIQKVKEKISKLSQDDKDRMLAALLLTSDRIAGILKSITITKDNFMI